MGGSLQRAINETLRENLLTNRYIHREIGKYLPKIRKNYQCIALAKKFGTKQNIIRSNKINLIGIKRNCIIYKSSNEREIRSYLDIK